MAEQEKLRQELLRRAVLAQEEAPSNIAQELNDESSQSMMVLSWKLATLE